MDHPVIASLFLASFASGIFQLYILQIAASVFGPFRENLAIVLISTMLGIAIGSTLSVRKSLSLKKTLIGTLLGYLFFLLFLPVFISTWSMTSEFISGSW